MADIAGTARPGAEQHGGPDQPDRDPCHRDAAEAMVQGERAEEGDEERDGCHQ